MLQFLPVLARHID